LRTETQIGSFQVLNSPYKNSLDDDVNC
jgi:hypothetical protein